jgi:hypothetical protein
VSKFHSNDLYEHGCCKCGIFEKIFPVNHVQIYALAIDREKIVMRIFPSTNVSAQDLTEDLTRVRRTWRPLTYENLHAERCSAIANSFPVVEVLRGRKLLDRSCKIAVSFYLILKYLNVNQLKHFFVVSVWSSTLTMNLTFSPNTQFWAQ